MRAVREFWAAELGCTPEDLSRPGTLVVAHSLDYRGAHVLLRGDTCIVSTPLAWRAKVAAALSGVEPSDAFDAACLSELFGGAIERIIGPAFLGYLGPQGLRMNAGSDVRLLGPADGPALLRLRSACTPIEWEHSSTEMDHPRLLGLFAGSELAAVGSLKDWGACLVNLGVLTHPAYRGRGFAREVGAALTGEALEHHKVPQYRTLLANEASMAVARSLGYEEWALTLAVRLTSAEP